MRHEHLGVCYAHLLQGEVRVSPPRRTLHVVYPVLCHGGVAVLRKSAQERVVGVYVGRQAVAEQPPGQLLRHRGVAGPGAGLDGLVVALEVRLQARRLRAEEPAPRALDVRGLGEGANKRAVRSKVELDSLGLHHGSDALGRLGVACCHGGGHQDVEAVDIRLDARVHHDLNPGLRGGDVVGARMRRHDGVKVRSTGSDASLLHLVEPLCRSLGVARLAGGPNDVEVAHAVRLHAINVLHLVEPLLRDVVLALLGADLQEGIVGHGVLHLDPPFPHLLDGALNALKVVCGRVGVRHRREAPHVRKAAPCFHPPEPRLRLQVVAIPRIGLEEGVVAEDVGLVDAVQHVQHPALCGLGPAGPDVRLDHQVPEDAAERDSQHLLPPEAHHRVPGLLPLARLCVVRHHPHPVLERDHDLLVGHAALVKHSPSRCSSQLPEDVYGRSGVVLEGVNGDSVARHGLHRRLAGQLAQELLHLLVAHLRLGRDNRVRAQLLLHALLRIGILRRLALLLCTLYSGEVLVAGAGVRARGLLRALQVCGPQRRVGAASCCDACQAGWLVLILAEEVPEDHLLLLGAARGRAWPCSGGTRSH
mmetsp:Transcript_57460/g.178094  ORF Transcript_57460/g.178094 Transcript_57460/m.178094 type:complete len:589 (-) Transcript_57460:191-1957(-)